MPIALVVAQLADNAFVSAAAILGVMLGTGQIGLVGSQPSMQQNLGNLGCTTARSKTRRGAVSCWANLGDRGAMRAAVCDGARYSSTVFT